MQEPVFFWLILNITSLLALTFYSMLEMAVVSYNRVRLAFFVSKGSEKAQRLAFLIQNPALLFGTTLVGVNAFLVIGSEAARELFTSLGWSLKWASLYEILIVVIFGELTSMFAARRYPEHVAHLGINALYYSALILKPFLYVIQFLTKMIQKFLIKKGEEGGSLFLSRDELLLLLQEQDPFFMKGFEEEELLKGSFYHIFSIHKKTAKDVLKPLNLLPILYIDMSIADAMEVKISKNFPFFIVFPRWGHQIAGIVFIKDLIEASPKRRVKDFIRPLNYVKESTSIIEILRKMGSDEVVFVMDNRAHVEGFVTKSFIIRTTLGSFDVQQEEKQWNKALSLQKTVSTKMTLDELKKHTDIDFHEENEMTIHDLFTKKLGQPPEAGDKIYIGPYELTIKNSGFIGDSKVTIVGKIY